MYAKVYSAGVVGVDGYPVEVECDTGPGLNTFEVVGLPETTVRESRVRVRSSILNSGFKFPSKKIIINLAPADVPKRGTVYDLPQAIALLSSFGMVDGDSVQDAVLVGELSLTGETRPVPGILPMTIMARDRGFRRIFLPMDNAPEAAVVNNIDVFPVRQLEDLISHLTGEVPIEPAQPEPPREGLRSPLDLADVKGQEFVKEAMVVAAAGGHNVLMVGSPGSGKTMLARRLPTILPPMSTQESLETTKIYSVSGLMRRGQGLITARPFRSPHHTVSNAALVGGGSIPRPGEVSLAHHGVLFLDELPEFPRSVLETLRQPLEDRIVTVARTAMTCDFPASVMLVASLNPCPCGHRGDSRKKCTCEPQAIQRYMSRLSGPLLDRIDMHIQVRGVAFEKLHKQERGMSSEVARERVLKARSIQQERFGDSDCTSNASMGAREVGRYCWLDESTREQLQKAFDRRGMSARAYDRLLKVARTIADLEEKEQIGPEHIALALDYRQLDSEVS